MNLLDALQWVGEQTLNQHPKTKAAIHLANMLLPFDFQLSSDHDQTGQELERQLNELPQAYRKKVLDHVGVQTENELNQLQRRVHKSLGTNKPPDEEQDDDGT